MIFKTVQNAMNQENSKSTCIFFIWSGINIIKTVGHMWGKDVLMVVHHCGFLSKCNYKRYYYILPSMVVMGDLLPW